MAGLHHSSDSPDRDSGTSSTRSRACGLVFFAIYLVFYAGFVLLNALAPALMEQLPLAGINLAVLYGLALIVMAFLLALLYDWLCRLADHGRGTGEERR